MATYYHSGRTMLAKEQLEKQLFKDVQKLVHYLYERKNVTSDHDNPIMQSYERMIQERCDALGNLARR